MPAIGPPLPPQLQSQQQQELASPEEYRASAGSTLSAGPQLSPHLQQQPKDRETMVSHGEHSLSGSRLPSDLQHTVSPSAQSSPAAASKTRSIGPALPPHLAKRDREEAEDDIDDQPSRTSPEPPTKKTRTVGPAPPPAPLDQRPTQPATDDRGDDEDDYGPTLLGPGISHHMQSNSDTPGTGSGQKWDKNHLNKSSSDASKKRDEWMLMPPEADDLAAKMDPTKIRARKFNAEPTGTSGGMSKSWTETPEEKRKRLEDQVLGISNARQDDYKSRAGPTPPPKKAGDQGEKRKTGPSLYDMHKGERQQGKGEEADDPTKRAFDWEKDMKVGGNVSHKQKRELLNNAKNFGGRFSKGSSV